MGYPDFWSKYETCNSVQLHGAFCLPQKSEFRARSNVKSELTLIQLRGAIVVVVSTVSY